MVICRTKYKSLLLICLMTIFGFGIETSFAKIINGNKTDDILRMVKEVGRKHNVRYWNLHYKEDKGSWEKLWHVAMKQSTRSNYFSAYPIQQKKLSQATTSKQAELPLEVSLFLYVSKSLEPLKKIIRDEHQMYLNSKRNLVFQSNIWMIKMPDNSKIIQMTKLLNGIELSYDMKSFCFTVVQDKIIEIYDAYKIGKDSDITLKPLGTWRKEKGLEIINEDIWYRRQSLNGFHFRAVSAYSPPAITHIEEGCQSKSCFQGILADVWHVLSEKMNFTYTIRKEYLWGSDINGEWNGMVGWLNNNTADIAPADLTITKDRSEVVDFLPGLMKVWEELYLRNPGDAFSMVSYLQPFQNKLWSCVGLWFAIAPLILSAIVWLGNREGDEAFSLCNCYLLFSAAILNYGTRNLSQKTSSRIAFASTLVCGIVLYYHWEAEIMSHLAVRRSDLPFENLKELAGNPEFKLIVPRGTSLLDFFKYSKDPVYMKMWKENLEPFLDELPLYEEMESSILNDPYTVAY